MNKILILGGLIPLSVLMKKNRKSNKKDNDASSGSNNSQTMAVDNILRSYNGNSSKNIHKLAYLYVKRGSYRFDVSNLTNSKSFKISEFNQLIQYVNKLYYLNIPSNFELFEGNQVKSLFRVLNLSVKQGDIGKSSWSLSGTKPAMKLFTQLLFKRVGHSPHIVENKAGKQILKELSNNTVDYLKSRMTNESDDYGFLIKDTLFDKSISSEDNIFKLYYKKNYDSFKSFSSKLYEIMNNGRREHEVHSSYYNHNFDPNAQEFNKIASEPIIVNYIGSNNLNKEVRFYIPTFDQTLVISGTDITKKSFSSDDTILDDLINHVYIDYDEFCIYGHIKYINRISNAYLSNKILEPGGVGLLEFKRLTPFDLIKIELNESVRASKLLIRGRNK